MRGGIALEPYYANLAQMDWRITKSHGLMAEYEARYALRGRPGASSLLLFWNTARMGSYEQVLADPAAYGNDIAATRADGRNKYGFALSVEQQTHRARWGRSPGPAGTTATTSPGPSPRSTARSRSAPRKTAGSGGGPTTSSASPWS